MRKFSSMQKWKILMIACCITYTVFVYFPLARKDDGDINKEKPERLKFPRQPVKPINEEVEVKNGESDSQIEKKSDPSKEYYEFKLTNQEPFWVEKLMTNYKDTLKEKFTCKADKSKPPKLISVHGTGHSQVHLGGCPDWNCQMVSSSTEAGAVITYSTRGIIPSNVYNIFYSQESPKNAGSPISGAVYNFTLGFRHDSPASSPYGYTVKLAPRSYMKAPYIDPELVAKKNKSAAWFVSHCGTNSARENIVNNLQKYIEVDVYGACGTFRCPRSGKCEDMLDTDYHFYFAFENSICQDYITEKLWSQGYTRHIVPVVLKRSIVEPFVPPNSFIAVDDFDTLQELAERLKFLMNNKDEYTKYFDWRKDYRVIFLDGNNHDFSERPWGFCQICRLLWEEPKPEYTIPDFHKHWAESCEEDGQLAGKIIANSNKQTPIVN